MGTKQLEWTGDTPKMWDERMRTQNFFGNIDPDTLQPVDIFGEKYSENHPMGSLGRALEIQNRNRGMQLPAGLDPLTDPPPPEKGLFGKAGDWIGGHPLDAAKIGLSLWRGVQQNRALDQQDEYLKDVRKAMAFDQADVDRRWNLAMGDYRVREEDQNQFRASQGMENKKTNFSV